MHNLPVVSLSELLAMTDNAPIDWETAILCGEHPEDVDPQRLATLEITEYSEVGGVGHWFTCSDPACLAAATAHIEASGNRAGQPEPLTLAQPISRRLDLSEAA